MGLDSTAYTLVAPAWTAKKDRIPEHTSRTTYRDRERKGELELKPFKYISKTRQDIIQSNTRNKSIHTIRWVVFSLMRVATLQ